MTLSIDDRLNQGLAAHQAGDLTAAAAAYRAVLDQDPAHPDALNLLGAVSLQQQDYPEAIRLLKAAIAADPQASEFFANLGEAYRGANQIAPAIDTYRVSVSLDATQPAVWANLATLLQRTLRFAESIAAWRSAVALQPESAEFQNNLGSALVLNGELAQAVAPLTRATELRHGFREAIRNLSGCLLRLRQMDQATSVAAELPKLPDADAKDWLFYAAIACDAGEHHAALDAARKVLAAEPDNVKGHQVLGQIFSRMGEQAAAAMAYAKVIELQPELAPGHASLGLAALHVGRLDEAATAFDQATTINPQFAEAWFNLAIVHERMGKLKESLKYAERAREIKPQWPGAHNMIALLQLQLGDHALAQESFDRALALDPNFVPSLAGLGNVYTDRGDHDKALQYIRRSLEIHPHDFNAHSVLMMSMLSSEASTPEAIFEAHQRFGRMFGKSFEPHENDPNPDRRVRIGYVSPDLRAHSVSFFLMALFAHHDHATFEIVAYDDANRPDSITQLLRGWTDRWHRVVGMSNDRLAELIREHQIDVLVDLAGHTSNNRLMVFAAKPAPIQVSYLGYPATTGLSAMDYRFTDAYADPPGMTEGHHTEELVRLPNSFLAYSPPETPEVQPLPALTNGYVTFTSFNNSTKIHRGVLALWIRVLQAVPNSRLIVKANALADKQLCENIRTQFAAGGIGADRLTLLPKTPTLHEHMSVYHQCDIALDTFPYNGTTTTCEALWMGVPTVTLAGKTHVARVGVSINTNVGLSDWIADDEAQYVAIAAKMAADLPKLAELRSTMRQRMIDSPLMKHVELTRNIESSYRQMWKRWCGERTASTPRMRTSAARAGTKSLLIDGWRFSTHSYALVNQAQCLELLKRDAITLLHHEGAGMPGNRMSRGLFSPAEEMALAQLPDLRSNESVDVAYRIRSPLELQPYSAAARTFAFTTVEFPGMASPLTQLPIELVTPSEWSRQGLLRAGADASKVHVVPHGVDTTLFHPQPDDVQAAERRRHRLEGFVYLHVGAMTSNKGILELLRSFAGIVKQNPNVMLLLKGNDALYRSRDLLGGAMAQLDPADLQLLEPRARYVGASMTAQEMATLYAAADCYVTPYVGEGFNLPALEAVACGLPVIATAGGPTDAFGDETIIHRIDSTLTAMTVEGKLVDGLMPSGEHLVELMTQAASDGSWVRRAREAGPKWAAERFSWSKVVDRLVDVLEL